jgi:hypothetical protein
MGIQQILKRLELIKTSIAIEDEEIIELQISKLLSSIEIDDALKVIINHLRSKESIKAILLMDTYIEKHQKCRYGNYIASFVDILGQQEELKSVEEIVLNSMDKNDATNRKKVKRAFDKTYLPISDLRKAFREEYYSLLNENTDKNLTFNRLETTSFSDFVMNYFSLENTDMKTPIHGIYFMLFSTSIVFLKMLAKGVKIRGGIDIGVGMEISDKELFGPVLSNVYKLESTVSQYPRIVVGENLIKFLKDAIDITPASNSDKINIEFAKICFNVMIKDTDGVYIVDYLGENFEKYHGHDLTEFKNKAYDALVHEYQLHFNKGNQKLAERYFRVLNYFEKRLK